MIRRLIPASLLLACVAAPVSADNWPQWRGIKNDGHSAEKNLPTEWGPETNVVWKLPMPGRGASTPCIWGDKIFLTSMDGDDVALMCVGTDGKEKWKRKMGAGKAGYRGAEGDDASASCSTDGKHVWAYVSNGTLGCYDFQGKPVWEQDLQKYGKYSIQFGCHWTPVLYHGKLYLQIMHRTVEIIVALDAATGKEIWKVEAKGVGRKGTESPDTYASAFMWEGEGGPLLITHGNDTCAAHKLDDGSEVWRVEELNPTKNGAWRFVSSPLVTKELIVVPSCKSGPTVGINPAEARGSIQPESKGEAWRLKFTPDVVSPLLVDGIVYLLHSDTGALMAIEAKTGKAIYQDKKLGAKQIYRGHMVAADGKIYIVGREGTGVVVQAGKEFKILATNELKEVVYASPAIADGRLYIRTWKNLYCIGTK